MYFLPCLKTHGSSKQIKTIRGEFNLYFSKSIEYI